MAYDPNDPADKKIVDDAVAAALQTAQDEHEAEVERLNKKNADLLGKLKKAREGVDNAGEVERLESELHAAQAELAKASGDLRTATRNLEKVTGERDTLQSERDAAVTARDNEFKENQLTSALAEAKVAPVHTDAVKALLMAKNKITVEADGDERKVLVNGKPLGDFVKEYADSDAGKHYILAPGNAGGGANGANGGGSPSGNKELKDMSEAERTDMARNRPQEWDALVAANQPNNGVTVIQ